ncbi:Sec20 domain protein [Pseudohyphozyma bogoriensis]|nr:Sec20 domain protein [Pseudohyphozyma bogoriensis]
MQSAVALLQLGVEVHRVVALMGENEKRLRQVNNKIAKLCDVLREQVENKIELEESELGPLLNGLQTSSVRLNSLALTWSLYLRIASVRQLVVGLHAHANAQKTQLAITMLEDDMRMEFTRMAEQLRTRSQQTDDSLTTLDRQADIYNSVHSIPQPAYSTSASQNPEQAAQREELLRRNTEPGAPTPKFDLWDTPAPLPVDNWETRYNKSLWEDSPASTSTLHPHPPPERSRSAPSNTETFASTGQLWESTSKPVPPRRAATTAPESDSDSESEDELWTSRRTKPFVSHADKARRAKLLAFSRNPVAAPKQDNESSVAQTEKPGMTRSSSAQGTSVVAKTLWDSDDELGLR